VTRAPLVGCEVPSILNNINEVEIRERDVELRCLRGCEAESVGPKSLLQVGAPRGGMMLGGVH